MDQIVPWLTLKSVTGIGNLLFHRLVSHFGSPDRVLQASTRQLTQVAGVTPRLAAAIARHKAPDWVFRDIDRCGQKGFTLLSQHDAAYPALLLTIADPPPVLYCYGEMKGDWCHIAVVGSRRATSYGRSAAKGLCRELSIMGISIVSGMARGIDSAAHRAALDNGGKTIAVLGSGLNRIYPPENRQLFHQIAQNGAVLSEFPLDAEPEPHHFPQRNRIISGMSLGTVVVEAAQRSGSLITARLAAEQGREVYAVPGNIRSSMTRGTHELIRQGAKLTEAASDIIEEILPQVKMPVDENDPAAGRCIRAEDPSNPMGEAQRKVYEAIAYDPVHIDDLVRRCSLETGALTAILSELELMGVIFQEPGKFFVRAGVG